MRLLGRPVPVPVIVGTFLALCLVSALLSRPLSGSDADAVATKDGAASVRRAGAPHPLPALPAWSGHAFDACRAPSQAVMDRWRTASPFTGVGIYLGGIHRACEQRHLTSGWVRNQTRAGWRLLPIWVGPQASCTGYQHRIPGAPGPTGGYGAARAEGRHQARRAAAAARSLGLPRGEPVFYDIEPFDTDLLQCRASSLAFLEEWTEEVHRRGYRSGVYSHVNAGISLLSRTGRGYTRPDAVWYAWIDRAGDLPGEHVADARFMAASRVHQYALDRRVEFGGITMAIDWNYVSLGATGSTWLPAPCDVAASRVRPRPLGPGARGREVRVVQCLVSPKERHPAKTSGRFDGATVRAVRSYQSRTGLRTTGTVDRRTWTSLLARGSTPFLRRGAAGAPVRRLQRSLNAALGEREVAVDGGYGADTARAVRGYRKRVGLAADDVVTDRVWNALARGRIVPPPGDRAGSAATAPGVSAAPRPARTARPTERTTRRTSR